MECVLALLILLAIPGAIGTCGRGEYNATVEFQFLNDRSGSHTWSVGVPLINMSLALGCESDFGRFEQYYFHLLRPNETTDNISHSCRLNLYFPICYIVCHKNNTDFGIGMKCRHDEMKLASIDVTLSNAGVAFNSVSLAMRGYFAEKAFYRSPPITIKYCSIEELPGDLEVDSDLTNLYAYGDAVRGRCRGNDSMFSGRNYMDSVNIACGEYAHWVRPSYVCQKGCATPSGGLLQVSFFPFPYPITYNPKFSYGTSLELSCIRGRMYYLDDPSYFMSRALTTCTPTGSWDRMAVACWTGQVVDFNTSPVSLNAEQWTVFICAPRVSSNSVRMNIGEDVVVAKKAWLNITVTPKLHGIIVSCDEVDPLRRIVQKKETTLKVLREIVDFSSSSVTLNAGQTIGFSCVASVPSNSIQLKIGNDVEIFQTSAWWNITVTASHHGIITTCEEVDQSHGVVNYKKTALNVLYAPELLDGITSPRYELESQTSGQAFVEFRANPSLALANVQVLKNGSKITNYYLIADGVNHTVVIHFVTVDESDFNDYVMYVTSHPQLRSTLVVNFTITEGEPANEQPGYLIIVVIALGAVTALVVVGTIAFAITRTYRENGERQEGPMEMKDGIYEEPIARNVADVNHPAPNNYEEIKDKVAGTSKGSCEPSVAPKSLKIEESPYEYDK